MKKFIRRSHDRYSKLGLRRKKKQKWKKPTGRHNKMREKRRGYPPVVSVGYSSDKKEKGLIGGKIPVIIRSINDLKRMGENETAIIGNIGKKKKLEIVRIAEEKKIKILNLNIKKFLKKNSKIKEKLSGVVKK